MRAFVVALAVVGIVASASQVAFSQAKPAAVPSIEGVWRTTSVVTTGANASSDLNPPANILIFTKRHFSLVVLNNPRERPAPPAPKDPNKLTDAEKIARYEDWRPFNALSGTYEIKGTTVIRHSLVEKGSPAPGRTTYEDAARELRFEGNDKMVQITKAADGKSVTTRTYTRIE